MDDTNKNNGYAPIPRISNEKTPEVSTPTNSGSAYNERPSVEEKSSKPLENRGSNVIKTETRTSNSSMGVTEATTRTNGATSSNVGSNSSGIKSNNMNSSSMNRPIASNTTPVSTYQAPMTEKLAGADKARSDAQNRYNEEERMRRQRETTEKAKLDNFKKQNKKQENVNLNMVVPPTARRMDPPKTRDVQTSNSKRDKFFNKVEIENIKNQVRMTSPQKTTVKQALGRTVKKVGSTSLNQSKDVVGSMGSDYAAAEYTKKQASKLGVKAVTALGLGGALKAVDATKGMVGSITAENSAKELNDIATNIATKGASKMMNIDKSIKKRAEEKVRKQTRKVEKLDRKYDKINKKELQLREKADKKYSKAEKNPKKVKYKEKGDKLSTKANKMRDKRAKKNQKLGVKRSKQTIRLNKVKAKARKKIKRVSGFKKLLFKLAPAALLPICFIVIVTSVVGGGAGAAGIVASKFVSDICDFLSLEWTATGKELARLENMNWAQYIADDTAVSLGDTFVDAAKKDAQQHYVDRKITLKEALTTIGDKSYPQYDWYCDLGEGSIGKIWMREQCDCITDVEGKMIYDSEGKIDGDENKTSNDFAASDLLYVSGGKIDTMSGNYGYDMKYVYEKDENNRITLTPNANIVPILSLAHDRYTEEWTWENYEVVEAYVWYMYTLSHNAAHYDDNTDSDEGTYTYVTQQMCDNDMFSNDNYLDEFDYDSGSVNLTRPGVDHSYYDSEGVKKEVMLGTSCTNVFFHGYNKDSLFGDAGFKEKVKEKAKGVAKKVLSWIDSLVEWATDEESDLAETIMQAGTFTISYERDSNGFVVSNGDLTGTNGSDTYTGSLQRISQIVGVDYDGNGNAHYCDNIQGMQKDGTTTCGQSVHSHGDGNCTCPKALHTHGSGCTYDHDEHTHTSGCSYTKCGYDEEHQHGTNCEYDCDVTEHKHDDTCPTKKVLVCEDTHTHSYGSGGCFDYTTGTFTCGHTHSHSSSCYETVFNCGIEEHTHGIDCECKKDEHTHTSACCSIDYHSHTTDCCTKEEHKKHDASCCTIKHLSHKPWNSISDPGCYDTFAYCAGHCGGHIKPSVNLAITYTMEGLSYQDAVALEAGSSSGKDSSWTGNSDMQNLISDLNKVATLREWATTTNDVCGQWFKAGPNGPISALCYVGESLEKAKLTVFRGWRDFWKNVAEVGLIDAIFGGGDDQPEYNDSNSDADGDIDFEEKEGEDAHQFEGWFEGSGTSISFKKELFDELHDLYGDPDSFYREGLSTWESFDVQFRVGFGKTLTDEDISSITNAIEKKYYPTEADKLNPVNQKRLSIITNALESCGYYNYNNSSTSHNNGMYSSMGATDSTGFVSGIYMRVLGSECGWWNNVDKTYTSIYTGESGLSDSMVDTGIAAQNQASLPSGSKYVGGTYLGSISNAKPGDVLLDPSTGYALIYLGNYTNPITGTTGHYVVDCKDGLSKTSEYRLTDAYALSKYTLVYRPTAIK